MNLVYSLTNFLGFLDPPDLVRRKALHLQMGLIASPLGARYL